MPEQKVRLLTESGTGDIYVTAVRLLSYRPRSEAELYRRLSRKFPSQSIASVLQKLRDQGLVDDIAFAEFWRDNRESHKPRSIALLRQELRRLGVDRSIIENALRVMDEDRSAYHAALRLLPRINNTDWSALWKKLSSYLGRRGFQYGTIRRTVLRISEELPYSHDRYVEGQNETE